MHAYRGFYFNNFYFLSSLPLNPQSSKANNITSKMKSSFMHNFVLETQQKDPLSTKFPDVKERLQKVGIT